MQAIAALRAKASGAYDDHGITTSSGGAMIADGDANSIAYSRNPNQARAAVLTASASGCMKGAADHALCSTTCVIGYTSACCCAVS